MKLFRKIRQTLIKEGNLKRYLLYAIGEILLVMIGISLAFQLDNWNEDRIKKISEIRYYQNLRDQIADDKDLIQSQIEYNNRDLAQYRYANELIEANERTKMDTLGRIVFKLTRYSDFDKQGNIYETMVNSGEIKLLRNHGVVNGVRELEERYTYMNRMENIHYEVMIKYVIPATNPIIKYSSLEVKKPDLIFSYEFQNMVIMLIKVMEEKDETYNDAICEIDRVTELINEELAMN